MGEMKTKDRMLAEAWRDLAGWHVGMVLHGFGPGRREPVTESMVRRMKRGEGCLAYGGAPYYLPALESPANWGHWAAWAEEHVPGVTVPRFRHDFARLLLRAAHIELRGEEGPGAPPSVLAWWKAEQEGEAE